MFSGERKFPGRDYPLHSKIRRSVKNLLILRHGTAEATGADGTDFSRVLTGEGVREASIQGEFLREAGIIPQQIASSSALRARATTQCVIDSIGGNPAVSYLDELYNAPGEDILEQIRAFSGESDTVLVVAHMPGVAEVLDMLTSEFAEVTFPIIPATLVGVSFSTQHRWDQVQPGAGVLEWLLPPLLWRE